MSVFSDAELAYLTGERRLARIATVGKDGTPHVVPVGWRLNAEKDTIDVGGRQLEASQKFRDIARSGRAAIVIDDLASTNPGGPGRSKCAAGGKPSQSPNRLSVFAPNESSPGDWRARAALAT